MSSTPDNKQDLKLKLLMDYVVLLSHGYEERLSALVEYASQFYANQREYEWTIRRMSSTSVKSVESMTMTNEIGSFAFTWPETIRDGLKLSQCVQDFNVQLANEFDLLKQNNAQLSRDVQSLNEELKSIRLDTQHQLAESEAESKSLRETCGQLEADFETYRSKRVANELKHNSIIETLTRTVAEYKQQLFIQKQETLTRHRSVPVNIVEPMADSSSEVITNASNADEHADSRDNHFRIADLEFRLGKQRELNERLKRLLQSRDQLKLVDDYNALYHKNIDLQNINRRLVEYLKINDIEVDEGDLRGLDVDGAIEDLVDQRNAWKQNTRILEHQVFSLQREVETLKSTATGIGMSLENESTPTISDGKLSLVASTRAHRSQPNLNSTTAGRSIENPILMPESRNFVVKECPYCAPAVTINI